MYVVKNNNATVFLQIPREKETRMRNALGKQCSWVVLDRSKNSESLMGV